MKKSILKYLKKNKWYLHHEQREGQMVYYYGSCTYNNLFVDVTIEHRTKEKRVDIDLWNTDYIPEERRAAVAELIAHLNMDDRWGRFLLDWKECQIGYRITFFYAAEALNLDEFLDMQFRAGIFLFDSAFLPFVDVAFNNEEPLKAMEWMEAFVLAGAVRD
ncbi:MAG: hypothetical protein WD604_09395 [Balneolaceae bacterium]